MLLGALAIAIALERYAPYPAAVVVRGTEEPFASGLFPRELPPRGVPLRWTGERARFQFANLPPGTIELEVGIHGQRAPVAVAANGVVLGVLEPGMSGGHFAVPGAVPGGHGRLDVELRTPGFRAGDGRLLGALLDFVVVRHARGWLPPVSLILVFLVPALALLAAAHLSGVPPALGAGGVLLVLALEVLALTPGGIVRSPYAVTLAASLVLGAAMAAGFARWAATREPPASPFGFAAFLAAFLVQGVAATSPVMVVSDVMFHANKLMAVAAGDWFPTSVTQHAPPFRIPYGVSFYALLAPFVKLGADPAWAVRIGAAAAGVLGSAAVFRLALPLGAARAAAATILLQLLPGAFDVPYSHGNLSNGFGQAMTILFLAWWVGRTPGGWLPGALVFVLAGLGHLSSLIVLLTLTVGLLWTRPTAILADRPRRIALVTGLIATGLYYASFASLVAEQLPRLLGGPGLGRRASSGMGDVFWLQIARLGEQWGLPVLALGFVGVTFDRQGAPATALDRDLTAFWCAGLALAAAALVSPLEVRYLYALTVPLAVAAGRGGLFLWERQGWPRAAALFALAAQAVFAARGLWEAVLHRYRP